MQDGLFTRSQARAAGLTDNAIQHRSGLTIARVLPTVFAVTSGPLSNRQRLRAAVLYGRAGGQRDVAILGGLAACALHGLKAAGQPETVQLLLPAARRLADQSFVAVRRTQSFGPTWRVNGLPVCSPARAVVDAARRKLSLDDVRALAAECIQKRKATTDQVAAELHAGASAGSLLLRLVLAEVADGVHSVAEAQLRRLLRSTDLPQPRWNADLKDAGGKFVARPDAFWAEAGLIVEVQSREWHLSPQDWGATMRRTNRLSRLGYDVQQVAPSRISSEPTVVLDEIRAAYAAGLARAAVQPKQL